MVTVNDSQSLYGVSVTQKMNPVTLNKFMQTQKDHIQEGGIESEISFFSVQKSHPSKECKSQVRLMPMKNALIQEYYDNKKSMIKFGTSTKYTTSKLY